MRFLEPIVVWIGLQGANLGYVLFGSVLLGLTSGALGCFAFLRKRALLGDALTHCSLPGICLAFLATGSKNPLILLVGAFGSGITGAACIQALTKRSPIKEDTAIAAILSVFFGLGIVLMTRIQHSAMGNQAGLDKFLFGQAASLVPSDLNLLFVLALFLGAALVVAFKEFKIVTFDPAFAESIGMPVVRLDFLLATLVVVCVVIGLQLVGVVLMAAMLITPAAAARQWTERLVPMLLISGGIGALGGALGVIASSLAPRMPTGPWIVVTTTFLFVISLIFAPGRGLLTRVLRLRSHRRKTVEENVLRTLYKIAEEDGQFRATFPLASIVSRRHLSPAEVKRIASGLARKGYLQLTPDACRFTEEGLRRAQRMVRLHRLWEVYLTEKIHLPADHVDRDAEEIEHLITPDLERELERILARPAFDPHGRRIPRDDALPPERRK